MAKLLGLDKPSQPSTPATEEAAREERIAQEHRKRVWWTSYCMNRMVCTELGIPLVHEPASRDLQLPSSACLTPEEKEEFSDPNLLTALIQLCQIKFKVVETASHQIRTSADGRPLDVLGPCLTTLKEWRQHLPRGLSFNFNNGTPKEMLGLPSIRVIASLYLRYYHVCDPSTKLTKTVLMRLPANSASFSSCARILSSIYRSSSKKQGAGRAMPTQDYRTNRCPLMGTTCPL